MILALLDGVQILKGTDVKIAMIGSGYVGLVSGACLADFGQVIICVSKDFRDIDQPNVNVRPIYEPQLNDLISEKVDVCESGKLCGQSYHGDPITS